MNGYDESRFRSKVNAALERVRTILDNTRTPQYAADVSHEYSDKYMLAEFLTNTAISSHLASLEAAGMNDKVFAQLKEWSKTRSVTLRLKGEEHCKFLRTTTREEKSDTTQVSTSTVFGTTKHFSVTKITEHFWAYDVKWELVAFMGTDTANSVVLVGRSGNIELKTTVESTPKPESVVRPSIDVNITWLLQNTADDGIQPTFSIDRKSEQCRTPRRNPEIEGALSFMVNFYNFAGNVYNYFNGSVFPTQTSHGIDISYINKPHIFVPVVPLFEQHAGQPLLLEDKPSSSSSHKESSVLPSIYSKSFLQEQARTIVETLKEVMTVFPADKLITFVEAKLLVLLLHTKKVSESFSESVDYIEDMLRKQLVAAIGKEVSPVDFTNYLTFHNRKLFKAEYQPQLFCYAIRRPLHCPEGTLSIEAQLDDGAVANPIFTIASHSVARKPMYFPINASTRVGFTGDRYVHGWVTHQFSSYSGTNLSLVARARQFSSFILLVGRIAAADLFEPKYGIIIQNKDELKIPLMLDMIPTPKEFKDAIESLSPEQQRFAKAYRGMQLESTLFGVCVIQIKPQLEKLLKLPDDSLTKEIQLSQDLLSLFIKYQIPSDLISFDGSPNESVVGKINTVRRYVTNMQSMIQREKDIELEEARKAQAFRLAQEEHDRQERARQEREQQLQQQSLSSRNVDLMSLSLMSADLESSSVTFKKEKKTVDKGFFGKVLSSVTSSSSSSSHAAPTEVYSSGSAPAPAPSLAVSVSASAPPPPATSAALSVPQALVVTTSASAAAPSTPAAAQPQTQPADVIPPQDLQPLTKEVHEESHVGGLEVVDYTKIPQEMESKFEQFDTDSALHATIINPGNTWSKKFNKSLLSEQSTTTLDTDEQGKERNQAFDLLDALTKSGALSIEQASLHIVIAATHCFDKTLMNTIIQDNVNPIEKVENSSLIVASTIHQTSAAELIAPEHLARVAGTSPLLIEGPK